MPSAKNKSSGNARFATTRVDSRMISVPVIEEIPRDAAWEKTESAFVNAAAKGLTPFEE